MLSARGHVLPAFHSRAPIKILSDKAKILERTLDKDIEPIENQLEYRKAREEARIQRLQRLYPKVEIGGLSRIPSEHLLGIANELLSLSDPELNRGGWEYVKLCCAYAGPMLPKFGVICVSFGTLVIITYGVV